MVYMEIITNTLNNIFLSINTFLIDLGYIYEPNDLFIFILIILFIVIIFQKFRIRKIEKIIANIPNIHINNRFTTEIQRINQKLDKLSVFQSETGINFDQIKKRLKNTNNINLIKYNPYKDMGVGGNQSFSLSILNKHGNGIILTSLYSREKSRTLIKKIDAYSSEQELTEEEKKLLSNKQQ